MQIIFQDPVSSLNPRMTIGNIIGEPIKVHGIAKGRERDELVASPARSASASTPPTPRRYPHEFSGGQRQRIGIARALALSPDFIVCDEPVSALDVSIQSQILNLLDDLQQDADIAYLFIAHNLAVVEHFSDEVAVMYLGRIVEKASRNELYANPKHPYTMALLSAVPEPDPRPERSASSSAAKSPAPAIPPPAAPSTPAANSPAKPPDKPTPPTPSKSPPAAKPSASSKSASTETPPLEQKQGDPGHVAACWVTK